MAAIEALEILGQIQVLVIDKLQVVSYKWLSRNFSVTSNRAKRLLQEFVDKHGDKVEVVYSLSGWLKKNARTYCIKLASRQNLEGAIKEFDGSYSVEVYSIQSCIPKDLAVLWNAEFVQAEQLFDQPSTAENCLRNNRFGGISNPFVNRAVNGKLATITSKSQLKESVGIALQTKDYIIPKDELFESQQGKEGNLGVKEELKSANTVGSVERTAQNVGDHTKKSIPLKESANSLKTSRKVVPNEKNSSASGGSLATLWGRASVKSKPSNMVLDSTSNMSSASFTADAQIFAQEAADAASSDDEGYGLRCKRESNVSGTRKRQFIINYSDEDEEEENVVRLASPKPKIEKSIPDSLQNTKNMSMEKEIFNSEELKADTLIVKETNNEEKNDRLSSRNDSIAESSLLKTENNVQNELANTNRKENSSNTSKRKKVVKTRIDERGREVMEVVWEESACTKDAEKDATTHDAGNRPTMANKAQATGNNALGGNTGTKGGTKKPGKAGGKDVKQGNILTFFRKV